MSDKPARCPECGSTTDWHSTECGLSWSPDYRRAAAAVNIDSEPAAWIDFADNGNIRFWTADPERAKAEKETGRPLRMFTLAELVALSARPATVEALKTAIGHVEHMAAWIAAQNAGYSFEGLGEDIPGIRAALARVQP